MSFVHDDHADDQPKNRLFTDSIPQSSPVTSHEAAAAAFHSSAISPHSDGGAGRAWQYAVAGCFCIGPLAAVHTLDARRSVPLRVLTHANTHTDADLASCAQPKVKYSHLGCQEHAALLVVIGPPSPVNSAALACALSPLLLHGLMSAQPSSILPSSY